VNLVDPDGRSFFGAIWGGIRSWWYAESAETQYIDFTLHQSLWTPEDWYWMQMAQAQNPVQPSGVSGNTGFINVNNPSKTGPQQDRIRSVMNWINTNVDDNCAKWLSGIGDAISSLLGDPSDDRTVLIGHGAFNNSGVAAFVGNSPSQTDIPDGYAMTVNDMGLFFNSISGLTAGGYTGGTSKAQVFILLHELAHWVNAAGFQNDFQNSAATTANDNLVKQNCGKTINAAKNIP
jgi:hypothetical protein